jgi:hypothetical protein
MGAGEVRAIKILPELVSGRGTKQSLVEGPAAGRKAAEQQQRRCAPPLHRLRRSPSPSKLGEELPGTASSEILHLR